jgi:polysaccharide biosynthesis protein PslG
MPVRSTLASLVIALAVSSCHIPAVTHPASSDGVSARKALSLAILEDYDKHHDLDSVAGDFSRFRELGITTWRGSFGWDDYEPEPGKYDFTWLVDFVELARDSGITLRPYVGYTPEWAASGRTADGQVWNDPPRDLATWQRFIDTLVGTLAAYPNVASWEIYNEENVALWWDGTAAEYNAVLSAAAERIRARDPDAEVLIGGTVWPDGDWLEAACLTHRNAGAFDIAAFHAYPETWPDTVPLEEYLDENYRRGYLETVDSACGGKPVWINEAGFATTPGRTEEDQARWWARAFPVFLSAPRVEHIGVYEIRDLRPESDVIGDAPNYYLGLLRVDGTPKLAFRTVAMLARLFDADSLTVMDHALELTPAADLQRHLFQMADGRQLLFVWRYDAIAATQSGSAPIRSIAVTLPSAGSRAVRHRLDGTSAAVSLARGGRRLTLDLATHDVAIVEIFR